MWQSRFNGDSKRVKALKRKLAPVFQLTPHVRPRLLLAALTADAELIVFGLQYHTERKAFRSCLRFSLMRQPEFVRCTRWKQWATRTVAAARYAAIAEGFASVASELGTREVVRLEFAAAATDAAILEALLASRIAPLVMSGSQEDAGS